jgi:hypothetical protein
MEPKGECGREREGGDGKGEGAKHGKRDGSATIKVHDRWRRTMEASVEANDGSIKRSPIILGREDHQLFKISILIIIYNYKLASLRAGCRVLLR